MGQIARVFAARFPQPITQKGTQRQQTFFCLTPMSSSATLEAKWGCQWLKKGNTMEKVDLPLSELTLAQKLDLMEAIWEDLAKHEKTLESPPWHEQVLKDREEALAAGKASVSDWEEAKDRIRKNVSCE